jgi:DNA-binding transcriptional regulator GbsR (MarR family)
METTATTVLTDIEEKFIDGVNNIGSSWGINAVESKIIGFLFTQDKPSSLNDIVEALNISKGNISVCIRKLEEKHIVKKVWVKGDRKDYYEMTIELWEIFLKKLGDNFKKETIKAVETIESSIAMIQEAFQKLNSETSTDKARNFMQKLQKMKGYYALAEDVCKTIEAEGNNLDVQKMRVVWESVKGHIKVKK